MRMRVSKRVSVQVDFINGQINLSCNDLPFFILEEVINEINKELTDLILERKSQP